MLNYTEFQILNNLYNKEHDRNVVADFTAKQKINDRQTLIDLQDKGLVGTKGNKITAKGLVALEPYKVKNAVILAAGASTRFIPLSLEQPKGLFEVKGERLIERQIRQLQEAGIKDITLVLGYKKEMFFYLKKKFNVNFVFNSSYNVKNNIESLRVARKFLGNSYICSSDDYFVHNPFNTYEYQSFYAGMYVEAKTGEMYVDLQDDDSIAWMEKGRATGNILLGHSYWTNAFAAKFLELADDDVKVGVYNNAFWEWLVRDNLQLLPKFYFKQYPSNIIYEFDYFEDLRKFDLEYQQNTHSSIIRNIKLVFRCDEEDIIDFRNVNEGMTNTSFIFKINGVDYIYRHPGDGTENIINRRNEKKSLEKAKEIGIDPTYIYADVNEGWKISKFVPSFREPDYTDFEDSKKILGVLRKLHASDVIVDYGMKPWDDALEMEKLILKTDPNAFKEFAQLKEQIKSLYLKTIDDGVEKCFCHGDTYKPNWMIKPDDDAILIDWEYSGYSDPGIDVGYYIVDAMYDFDEAKAFIKEYLKDNYSEIKEFHFMAYTAIIAYYWFVWAMYRESCGAVMGEALYNWYSMAKKYAEYLV